MNFGSNAYRRSGETRKSIYYNFFDDENGYNKYRLITSIHFNRGKVYIRHVLTHAEYDRGDWKNDTSK